MKGKMRREEIVKILSGAKEPVCASVLADKFSVSRQIIVKDIALLRSGGFNVVALSRGYVLNQEKLPSKVFKTIHSDEDVEKELNLIVDLGGVVEDVFIYHKFYNKVRASMNIRTRTDVKAFLENISSGKSSLLKNVTAGYHYHTVTANNEETLKSIENKLWEAGFLAPLQEYEPTEIQSLQKKHLHS